MILLIDNFDSRMSEFYKYITRIYSDIIVLRNDEMCCDDILATDPDGIIIGSGVGRVQDTGVCSDIIEAVLGKIPLLCIGLGAEVLAERIGCEFIKSLNDKYSCFMAADSTSPLFEGVSSAISCTANIKRVISPYSCGENVTLTARDEYDRYLAFEDRKKNAFGICAYPVFFGEDGEKIMRNFVRISERNV